MISWTIFGILILVIGAVALLGLFMPRDYGPGVGQVERRHPEKHFQDGEDARKRRRDDNVGGEGG